MQTGIRREMLEEAGVSECPTAAGRMREGSPPDGARRMRKWNPISASIWEGATARTDGRDDEGKGGEERVAPCCVIRPQNRPTGNERQA